MHPDVEFIAGREEHYGSVVNGNLSQAPGVPDLQLVDLGRIGDVWVTILPSGPEDIVIMDCPNDILRECGAFENDGVQA